MKNLSAFFFIFSILLLTASRCILIPEDDLPENITIVSYNVCNLFDSTDNGTEYPEYDPSGDEWNKELYLLRLNNISTVLSTVENFDIVLLQEVENLNVINDLSKGILKKYKFNYTAAAEKGGSAVTTGIMSRYPVSDIQNHALDSSGSSFLRPVLEVQVKIGDRRLYLFNNHWKSKLGGAFPTEDERILAASVISRRTAEILDQNSSAEIIIAGDLNENIDEYIKTGKTYQTALFPESEYKDTISDELIFFTEESNGSGFKGSRNIFYTVWSRNSEEGSYFYRNEWETIDHFFLNRNLFNSTGFDFQSFKIHSDPLFTDKNKIPVKWENYRKSGYSDHLPIVLTLSVTE